MAACDLLHLRIRHAGGIDDDGRRVAAVRSRGEDVDNMDFGHRGSLSGGTRGDKGIKAC